MKHYFITTASSSARWQATRRRVTSVATAATLLISQITLPQPAQASHLGSSTASAGSAPPPNVSAIQSFQPDLFTGRATTSIPIVVPPGRKGMQPSLALSYSSSGRNGWVGVGWSLDVGYIERSTKLGVPKYDASDTFTFMFQGVASDLVKIPDGTYRAKDEGLFLRFVNHGVSGWEVRDKSGTRYLFGGSPDTEQTTPSGTFRWCLRKVVDTNGNFLTITYVKDQGQIYPSRIDYTGHETSGIQDLAPANRVELLTEARPDADVSFRSGAEIKITLRLKEIAAYAQGQLARKVVLSYTQSPRTGRSRLASVTQIGTDGVTSLPPTTFAYQGDTAPTYSLASNSGATGQAAYNVRVAVHDFRHENFGCGESVTHPYAGLNWSSPQVVSSSASIGCVTWTVNSDGTIAASSCQDRYIHAWIWVYLANPASININTYSFCAWKETAGSGVQLIPGNGSTSFPAGWSILHLTAHHEHEGFSANQTVPLQPQVTALSPSQFIKPQLAGDVDGNGVTDLVTFDAVNHTWTTSLSRGGVFSPGSTWLPNFGTASAIPLLGDWNADGRTDIGTFESNGSWRFATSTGSAFQADAIPPLTFGGDRPLTGDFNGDGVVDIGAYNGGTWSVALGTGSGFLQGSFATLGWGTGSTTPLTGDFNGDGLTDIARVDGGVVLVALSDGSRFLPQSPAWITGFGSSNYTTADVNGDGLTDVAYYDKSTGRVHYAPSLGTQFDAATALPPTFSPRSVDDAVQVGDFNGDGLADPAVFNAVNGASEIAQSSGAFPDLLIGLANGVGGTTTLRYQPSTQCDNVCPIEQVPKLPFILPVVNRVTVSDGLGNSYASTYFYQQGRYDAPSREFRGFAHVEARDPEANVTITEFHQDEHKKGRPFRSELRDGSGALWTKQEHAWSCTDPYPGVHFAKLDQADAFTYGGDATFRQTRARFEYDAYGNLTKTLEDGEPSVSGDERSATTTFVYNTAEWILSKPSLVQTLDAVGAVVAQRRFYYDGAPDIATAPTKGHLTKEEEWLTEPPAQSPEQWLTTTLTYEVFGNVATITDALGRITTNTYDPTGTYLTTIANHLGHTRQLTYDPRLGSVTRSIDQNGVTSTTTYDALGRVMQTGFIDPATSAEVLMTRTAYELTTVPTKTIVQARLTSGGADELTSYTFTDGLGRIIQTRAPAEDPTKQVVSGAVELNTRGLVSSQRVPYLSDTSSTYVPLSLEPSASSLASVAYTYDATGRLLTTTDPNGSVSSTSYDDWSVTSTDANGHRTRRAQDAYGRLATVEEFNGADISTTRYAYDALGNLTQVTDAKGNVTRISYDSLGRKLSMDDPDMGRWTYVYDAVDNLTGQTDARGVAIGFTYDTLNRLTQKTYTIPAGSGITNPGTVTYTYDGANDTTKPFTKGKLTKVADGSGSTTFEYDHLGRLVKEEKTVDGTRYPVNRTYDLLGRLTSLTYPDGDVATYTYNAQGGIETVTLHTANSTQHTEIVTNIEYNAAGQLTKLVYGNGVVTDYSYNPQTLRLSALSTQHTATSTVLQDFSYAFDPVGNVTEITDRAHTGSQSFAYDDLNRLTRATGAYGTLTYRYDAIGNMVEKEGITMTYGLADGSKPHAVTATSAGWSLQYDANGNLVSKTPSPEPGALSEQIAQRFAYDAENRLLEVATAPEETVSVTFHPGWNFFSLPVIPDDASIAALFPTFAADFEQIARIHEPRTPNPEPPFDHYVGNPKFDDFSDLEYGVGYQLYCKASSPITLSFKGKLPTQKLSKSLSAGWHLLPATPLTETPVSTWLGGVDYTEVRAYNRTDGSLTSVTTLQPGKSYWVKVRTASTWTPPLPKDGTTSYVYDGDGGKVKQTTASGTTTYLGEVLEKDPADKTTKYVFAGALRLAAKSSDGELLFYHTDHLGSSDVVTNATGAVVEHTEHLPYGAIHRHEGTKDLPHKFTGQRQDTTSGLVLFPARAYDPHLGRFLQPDPFVQDPSDPQTLNRYSYVRNNPINLVDPSGHFIEAVVGFLANPIVGLILAIGLGLFQAFGRKKRSNDQAVSIPILPSPVTFLAPPQLPNNFTQSIRESVMAAAWLATGDPQIISDQVEFALWDARLGLQRGVAGAKRVALDLGVSVGRASDVLAIELAKNTKVSFTLAKGSQVYEYPLARVEDTISEGVVVNPEAELIGLSFTPEANRPEVSLTSPLGPLTVSSSLAFSLSVGGNSVSVKPLSLTFGLSRTTAFEDGRRFRSNSLSIQPRKRVLLGVGAFFAYKVVRGLLLGGPVGMSVSLASP